MGRRKFCCVVRKNEERKKYKVKSLAVTIQLTEQRANDSIVQTYPEGSFARVFYVGSAAPWSIS